MKNRQGKLKTAGKQGLITSMAICLPMRPIIRSSIRIRMEGKTFFYYVKIKGQKNPNGGKTYFSFTIFYSKDRNALNKHRNKEYSNLSLDKKMSADTPSFTESDELVDKTNHGRTNSLREAVVLSKIDEENLNLDTKSDDTSVQSTDRIEIPYDGSPQVTVDTINKYLDGLRTKDDQQE